MWDKDPERSVAALRRAEGDDVPREKNRHNDAKMLGISISYFIKPAMMYANGEFQ